DSVLVDEVLDGARQILRRVDIRSGFERSSVTAPRGLFLMATTNDAALFSDVKPPRLTAVETASGKPLWSIDRAILVAAGLPDAFVVMDFGGRVIECLAATNGSSIWKLELDELLPGFRPREEAAKIRLIDSSVLLIVTHSWLLRVSLQAGEVQAQVRRPVAWPF